MITAEETSPEPKERGGGAGRGRRRVARLARCRTLSRSSGDVSRQLPSVILAVCYNRAYDKPCDYTQTYSQPCALSTLSNVPLNKGYISGAKATLTSLVLGC